MQVCKLYAAICAPVCVFECLCMNVCAWMSGAMYVLGGRMCMFVYIYRFFVPVCLCVKMCEEKGTLVDLPRPFVVLVWRHRVISCQVQGPL